MAVTELKCFRVKCDVCNNAVRLHVADTKEQALDTAENEGWFINNPQAGGAVECPDCLEERAAAGDFEYGENW